MEREMNIYHGPRIPQTQLNTNRIQPLLPIIYQWDVEPVQKHSGRTVQPLATMAQLQEERNRQLEDLEREQKQVEEEETTMFNNWNNS